MLTKNETVTLGYWLAKEAFHRGYLVKVIYGPGTVTFPGHIPVIRVRTTEDYLEETIAELESKKYDLVVNSFTPCNTYG